MFMNNLNSTAREWTTTTMKLSYLRISQLVPIRWAWIYNFPVNISTFLNFLFTDLIFKIFLKDRFILDSF